MQASPITGKEKCAEKLNQMKKYLPFIDFMINKIKEKADTLPLESQLSKFQVLKAMISERNEIVSLGRVLRMEDVIQQLILRLNYQGQNGTVNEESTGRSRDEKKGNNTRVKDEPTLPKVKDEPKNRVNDTSPGCTTPSSTAPSVSLSSTSNAQNVGVTNTVDVLTGSRDNNVPVTGRKDMSIRRSNDTRTITPPVNSSSETKNRRRMNRSNDDDSDGSKFRDKSNSNRNTNNSIGPGVPEETRPRTDSLSSSRGMPVKSYPSTSQETFSQSRESHTNIDNREQTPSGNYHGFITYENLNYRSDHPERVTVRDSGKKPQLSDRNSNRRHSNERSLYPVENSHRDRTVSPNDSLASRSSDYQSKTRLKDRSSSDSHRGHRSSEGVKEPRKDSGSRNDNDLEVVEVTSPKRSTGKSQRENSRPSLARERSRRHKTNSRGKDYCSESRREKRKYNSGGSVHQRKRRRVHVSNLSDYQLQKFVRKNMQYLPHLASLKTSEIREAIAVLGDEIFEGPSRSPIQMDTQDLDDFVNSEDSSECTSSKFPEVRSNVGNAENKNSECRVEEKDSAENTDRVIEVSENDSVLESDGSNPKDTGDDGVSDDLDFTKDTFDEFRPNIQPVSEKALLELTLPEPDELNEETLCLEPTSKSVPSEESNVKKAGCVEPSEKVQNPIHVRRHSSHSTTVQSMPSYRTKDIVYDNWRASTLTSTVVTIQGSNQTTQSNIQFDSQSIMASSSQSNHDMLNQMGNINVSQTVTNARVQQTNLFSPPLVNINPEQGGEISNSSQPLEATSYAEYKRLKNMEMRKLNQKPKLPKVMPQTSPESSVGGRVAGDENVPKRTQAVQTSRRIRSDRHTVFREEKTVTSLRDKRHSDYGGSRIRDKVSPNERARKDVDRRKRSDSEKISSSDTEETISPLDSLYKSEPKPQTGRGYGLQHFRIPKKAQSNTSSDKNTKFHTENIRKNDMVDENRSRSEESTNPNNHDKNSAHKGDVSCDSSEQITNTSKNDKDMSQKGEEDNTERSTVKIKNDVDTSRKERECRESLKQTTNTGKNDKDMSRKEEEDNTERSTVKIKNDVDTSHKEKGRRDSSEQTTNTSKNDKDMSLKKEEDGTSPERSTIKTKNDIDTSRKERGHSESLKQITNKAQSVKKVSRKGEKDCDIPKRPQKSSMADKKARRSVEENMDSSDEKAKKKENVGNVKEESDSRETAANTTEQTNTEIVPCHETTANTSDKNIIGNVDDNLNSRETIENTTSESNESKLADGKFSCHETASNTKEEDSNKDDDVKLDDLEEGMKTNDNKDNENGLGEKKTHERLESLDEKEKIEEDESSDSDWIDVETIEDIEPQATERDSSVDGQPGRTSDSVQDEREVTNTNSVKSEKDVSMNWVKTFVVGCFKNKNKKITDVLRRIHRLSVEEIEIIEKIINSAFDDPSASSNERENREKSNNKNENGENRESVGGSAENNNVEVDKSKKKLNSKNQKPSSSEIKKNNSEGGASEKNTEEATEEKTKKATDKGTTKTIKKEIEEPSEKEMKGVKEKEVEINIKRERSDSANDSLASNSNEEPKQLESTVTDVKRKARRCRRRREGMDFVIRKRNKKTPRKQEQKQLLEQSKELTSTAGADTGNLNSGEAQEPKKKLKGKIKSELDRLHDDIRSMFISSEVVKATGQRACRMLRECANNTNNSDIVRESAKAVEEQLKKISARNASRNGSRRNAISNCAGPSSTVTDETNRGPVVKDYHVSTQWPRIVMQKIDLNNLGYGEKISDTSVTFCRQKGTNKAIRSEGKLKSEPNTSLINNENVTKNIKNEKSGSKSTNGVSKSKKKTETEKSKPVRTAQTKQPETLGRGVEEKPKDTNQRNRSTVIVSSGGKKEPVEDLSGESLLNYAFEKTKKVYSCKLCPLVTEKISSHYKVDHPKSEILISRLSKTEAADAIREAAESDFEDNDLEDTPLHLVKNILSYRQEESSGYYCRMCSRPKITSVGFFFAHVSEHTGEHRYKCPSKGCNVTVPRRVLMKKHIIRAHPGSRFKRCENVVRLFPIPAESGCLYGFICSKCNFVQVHRKNLEKHIRRQHGGDKNIAIVKINLSSKNPPGDANTCNKDHQEVVARMANDIQASEQGKSNEEDIKNTRHKEAGKVFENQKRAEKRKHKDDPKLEEFTELRGDTNSNEEVGSKRPFLDAELETEIEVDESPSYLLKPEKYLETDSEAHLETNYQTNLETNFEAGLDEHFEVDSEPNLKSHLEAHLKPTPETNLETEQVEIDECADLKRFATIRGSDIIDPIESSDSRDTDSRDTDSRDANLRDVDLPFTTVASTSRPESDIDALKVGPLTAHLLDQTNVLYECYTKGCLFSTTSYVIFEKHLKISHSGIRWNGHCQVCRKNVRNKLHKNWPPIAFTLPSALVHLKTHARHALCQGSECLNQVNLLKADVDDNILNLNQVEESEYQRIEGDSSYPQKPLLRVRNLLGDRLSRPKDCILNTTQQDTAVNIVQEEPTASGYTEGIQNESLMFTIQDVRSLNPEVGSGSRIQFEEVISPAKSVREHAKVVARQPVIVRSCPTRQIAIRPDTSGIPIEVGHLQVVQAPVSSSSVALNPLTDSTLVSAEAVTLGTLPNATPVRITSSVPFQTPAPRFPIQPVMISAPSSLRSPTQVATLTTNSQAVVPNTLLMELEQSGRSSRDLNATVEQPVAQSVVDPSEIGIPQMGGKLRRQSVVQIGMGPTLPPLQPGEVGEADPSLQKAHLILPFGNKANKGQEIYQEMLTKEKLCHLFKCMASDCSFTCNNQTMFDGHINMHEANKRDQNPMLLKKGKKVYSWQECPYCCEVVTNPSLTLSRHIVDVHGHCMFQCAFCFYRAVSLNYVDIHQEVGHEELAKRNCRLIYKCRKFSNGQRMPTGLEMDTVEECVKPYICVECESKFLIPEEFQNHLIREHQPKPAYTCHVCKNQSLKADRLIAHYRRHHFARHQCYYCLHGKDAESAMVIHLCTRHFTHTPLVYKRVLAGGASVQGNELPLGSLKVITYNEVVSPHCKIELEEGSEGDENLASQESQELNAIVAELGITAEGEPGSSVPLVQERVPMRNNSAQDVSVTALLPNARFSSEDESGSGTVLISSGLSTQYRREVSVPESVENNNLLGQVPLETVNYQTPVSSQSVIMSRFDVNSERMTRSTTVIVERPQTTTTSCNLPVTSTVTSIPPAIHRLPQVVLTVNRGATVLVQKERSGTKVLRTTQAEENPAASSRDTSGDTSVSRDQQAVVVNPLQQESSINVESTVLTMSESNVKNSEGENNTKSKPEKRKVVERSTDETIQKQTHNPKNEVTNEKKGIQENETIESSMASTEVERKPTSLLPIENVINSLYKSLKTETPEEKGEGTNTTEEASASGAGSLPRTRFSSLRPMYRSDVVVRRNSREKSAVKKKSAEELTGESLYICGNRGCNFAAPRERQLLEHLVVCDDSRNFPLLECPHCSKMFKNNIVFLDHLKTHGPKKLSCGLCSYKSGLESSIVKHAKLKHRCKQLKALPTEPPKEGYLVYYPKNYKKEKQDFMESGYSPGDEDKLPLQSVYQINVKCAKCPYFTKVRSNMVRHLKIHAKSTETEGVVVPSTAPMNPVPCLDSKEKMFDKMTNLAASSQLAQAKERNATETLTPEEIAKLPQLVDEHMRFKCCLPDCKYITVDEGILKHHIKALHAEVTYYSCPHCKSTVHTDIRHVALEKIGFHLKHHDSKLYKCAHCIYFHYQKAIVEKHTFEKHPDRRFFVHTVREPTPEEDNSVVDTGTTVWKCVLCNDFQGPSKASVLDHLFKTHRTKSLYKCQFCDMKSNHGQSFTSHFASKHPGQSVSYFSTMIKQTLSSSESATISEPANDHFDTTPLWQRGASRVRHIRGILIEEEEVKRKKSKKAVEHTDSTSPQAATRPLASKPTSTPASSPVKALALILNPTSTSASTPAPSSMPSSTLTPTPTSAPAPAPASSPVKTLALILAPTSTSTPAQAMAPSLVSTLASASATASSPVSTPAQTLAPTSTPASISSPVKTLALILTPTSTSAAAVSPVPTSSRPQAPAPSPTLVSAPARTQTSPAPPTPVSTPSPTRIMNRDRASARAPTSIPVSTPAQTLATISTSTPTPSPVPASIPSPSPVPSSASTSAPSCEDQDVQRPSEKEAFVANQTLEKRRTRSHSNKKEALPRGQEDITFWVNSIIEQQRMEIERGKRLSETGGDSNDSQKSSRKRKKSDQDD